MEPKQAYEKLTSENPEGLVKQALLDIITTDPEYTYYYAKHIINGKV